ncbi:MAG: hypothetical protein ACREB0_00095 [Sphingopyxis sp.]
MKYLDLITDACRLRNIVDENETPSPEQAKTALRLLNQMCAAWKARGLDIQYFSTDKLTDTLTIADWAEAGVTAQLAVRLTAASPVSDSLALMAKDGIDTIRSKTTGTAMGEPIDTCGVLPSGEGDARRGDFFNG